MPNLKTASEIHSCIWNAGQRTNLDTDSEAVAAGGARVVLASTLAELGHWGAAAARASRFVHPLDRFCRVQALIGIDGSAIAWVFGGGRGLW